MKQKIRGAERANRQLEKSQVFHGEEGAGCLDCGRTVRPRLGAARSGTGFPGLAAASKKFPVEHSPAGAGAAGAAVDVGGGVQEGEAARGGSQTVIVLQHLPQPVAP